MVSRASLASMEYLLYKLKTSVVSAGLGAGRTVRLELIPEPS